MFCFFCLVLFLPSPPSHVYAPPPTEPTYANLFSFCPAPDSHNLIHTKEVDFSHLLVTPSALSARWGSRNPTLVPVSDCQLPPTPDYRSRRSNLSSSAGAGVRSAPGTRPLNLLYATTVLSELDEKSQICREARLFSMALTFDRLINAQNTCILSTCLGKTLGRNARHLRLGPRLPQGNKPPSAKSYSLVPYQPRASLGAASLPT